MPDTAVISSSIRLIDYYQFQLNSPIVVAYRDNHYIVKSVYTDYIGLSTLDFSGDMIVEDIHNIYYLCSLKTYLALEKNLLSCI